MQRHKKYLVITIWISTIAFIGAGFVGWGQYNYGSLASDAGVVGNVAISKKDLQLRYQEIYTQYANMLGQQKLDDAIAGQIEKMAISSLVTEAYMLNLAKEWNLIVLDEEVANAIVSMQAFSKDGKFNKEIYASLLAQRGLDPKSFESMLAKALLMQKLQKLLALPATPLEEQAFNAAYFSKDALSIQTIHINENGINVSEAEEKEYWQANKSKFKSTAKYDLEILEIKPQKQVASQDEIAAEYNEKANSFVDANGKKMSLQEATPIIAGEIEAQKTKKEALKIFVDFKNGKLSGSATKGIDLKKAPSYPPEFLEKLAEAKAGAYVKPVWNGKEFLAAKVEKITPESDMGFEEAKPLVKKAVIAQKASERLKEDALAALKQFSGKQIGTVSRAQDGNLSFLGQDANAAFAKIIESPKLEGFIILEDKAIVYKIMEQYLQFTPQGGIDTAMLSSEATKFKAEILASNMLEKLKGLYKVDLFMNNTNQEAK